jgi:hypothetical protein
MFVIVMMIVMVMMMMMITITVISVALLLVHRSDEGANTYQNRNGLRSLRYRYD